MCTLYASPVFSNVPEIILPWAILTSYYVTRVVSSVIITEPAYGDKVFIKFLFVEMLLILRRIMASVCL